MIEKIFFPLALERRDPLNWCGKEIAYVKFQEDAIEDKRTKFEEEKRILLGRFTTLGSGEDIVPICGSINKGFDAGVTEL